MTIRELDTLAASLIRSGRMPSPQRLAAALSATIARFASDPGDREAQHLAAQTTPRSNHEHVVYVSPSQREGSTYTQAAFGLTDPAMRDLTHNAERLPSVAGVRPGIGFWSDGAEETARVRVTDPEQLGRIGAALGAQYRQKAVLTFHGHDDGPDTRHVMIVPDTDPQRIHDHMMRHGIEYKTVLPYSAGSVVEAVDPGDTMRAAFSAYAAEAGATHTIHPGTSEFIGSDDRDAAQKIYAERLNRPISKQ